MKKNVKMIRKQRKRKMNQRMKNLNLEKLKKMKIVHQMKVMMKKRDSKKSNKIRYEIIKKFEDKISNLLKQCKKEKILPKCFENIVERLRKNLIEFNLSFSEGISGDFTSIFKIGILTEKKNLVNHHLFLEIS